MIKSIHLIALGVTLIIYFCYSCWSESNINNAENLMAILINKNIVIY